MGQQQQKGATPPPVSSSTAGLPAPPLQPPSAQSSYAPQPANAQPTNPNPPALPEQGANVAGDVWAPGTGPSGGYNGYGGGKSSKGATPPQMGGANGQGGQPGGTPQSQSPQQQPNAPVQQIKATVGQGDPNGAKNWQSFQFQDTSHPYAQQFNQLMQTKGPGAAYDFILNKDGGQGRTFLENAWGGMGDENPEAKETYKKLVNTMGGQGNALGLADQDYYGLMRQTAQGQRVGARVAARKAARPAGWVGPNKKGGA